LGLNATREIRPLAAGAFAAIIWGWGLSQWPQLLPSGLTVYAGAAPSATLITELVIIGVIAALVGPAFLLLFRLAQGGTLVEDETCAALTPETDQGRARQT
jgi:cytochrome bd ubiquinol oxidase subunit II